MNIEEDYPHIYIMSGGSPMVWVPVPYLMPWKCPDFQAGKLHYA